MRIFVDEERRGGVLILEWKILCKGSNQRIAGFSLSTLHDEPLFCVRRSPPQPLPKPPHHLHRRSHPILRVPEAVPFVGEEDVADGDVAAFEDIDDLFGFDDGDVGVVGAMEDEGGGGELVDFVDGREVRISLLEEGGALQETLPRSRTARSVEGKLRIVERISNPEAPKTLTRERAPPCRAA